MKKINFLAPPESTGGNSTSNGGSRPPSQYDPNLQLLMTLYPSKVTLTVQEACDALSVSDDFLYIRLNNGSIRGIKTGRNWAIPLTEVARLLSEGIK